MNKMGIIQTDKWMKDQFDSPIKICEKLLPYFKELTADQIYNQLLKFGMYKPSWPTKRNLDLMNDKKVWEQVRDIFENYHDKWSGPDVPIFLFPLGQNRGLFMRQVNTKSGVSFPDKMFLFISDVSDPKEIEALFVHEYHHVCRLKKQTKKMEANTLLDSLIIEGLAEYAVLKNCGESYLANWCQMYSKKEIVAFWNTYLKGHLGIQKNERKHDDLLYGRGRYPALLGYAAGFAIVENYYKDNNYSEKLSFSKEAQEFLGNNSVFC